MKKIILYLILGMFLINFVSAWDATRTINGNNITITINQDSVTDSFTILETVSPGVVILSYSPLSPTCGLAGNVLTCDSEDSTKRIINYIVSGNGTVSGLISQDTPPFTQKNITGNTIIGTSLPNCTLIPSCTSWSTCSSLTQTRTCTDSCGNNTIETRNCTSSTTTDDLMVNYVRGKIITDGNPASPSTQYKIEVLSGDNSGKIYYGYVDDSNVFLKGNGYFDTGDQIEFSTDDQFRVNVVTSIYDCNTVTENFDNGGNDNFNEIVLNCSTPIIIPVNHAPILTHINDVNVNEGQLVQIIANATDLDGNSLTYNINNSKFNKIQETTAGAIFTWQTNTSDIGTYNVLVNVNDGILSVNQTLKITVVHPNQKPILNDIPNITRNEDSGFYLDGNLNATDPDVGGTISRFAITYENASQVHCVISDSKLGITPAPNFEGDAICKIRAYDNLNLASDEKTVNIHIVNINDAPTIITFSPNFNPVYLHLNESRVFSITWRDVDSSLADVFVNWSEDEVGDKGIENSYTFIGKSEEGQHNVSVKVSDELNNTIKTWQIIVARVFSCSQQSGSICSSGKVCSGTIVNASDTTSCCIGSCVEAPPEFSKIKHCDPKDSRVVIDFNDPSSGDEFEVGDTIKGELNLENNYDKDQNFKLDVYFYDVEDNKKIETISQKVKVKDGNDKDVEYNFEIPNDLDEGTYYIFAKANDDICNEGYIDIDVIAKDHNVVINNLELNPTTLSAGNTILINFEIENLGSNDESVYLIAENKDLNISERTEKIDIDEGDNEEGSFFVTVPSNAPAGTYELNVSVIASQIKDTKSEFFDVLGTYVASNNYVPTASPTPTYGGVIQLMPSSSGSGSGTSTSSTKKVNVIYSTNTISSNPEGEINLKLGNQKTSTVNVEVSPNQQEVYVIRGSECGRSIWDKFGSLFSKSPCSTRNSLFIAIDILLLLGGLIVVILIIVMIRRR